MSNPTTAASPRGFSLILLTIFAVFASWLLHEAAHYLAGILLGYPMAMTLNTAFPIAGHFNSNVHEQWVSAAGPLVTVAQATIIFFAMRHRRRPFLYPFLFTCFYLRLLATAVSFLNPNDEARISKSLGLGSFTLPLLVVGLLGFLLYKTAQEHRFSKKVNWTIFLVIMAASSVIILSDQFLKIHLL